MATLRETIEHLGIQLPALPIFRTEDMPYLIMTVLMPSVNEKEQLISAVNLLLAFALRIEDLEKEVFEAKWDKD